MKTRELKIEGMSCNHCIMAVKKELGKLESLKVDDVQIGSAKVQYDESKFDEKNLAAAIEEAGYKLVN